MTFHQIALRYFDAFQSRDIERIKPLFCDSVTLRDWDIDAQGISDVIKANNSIFRSVASISVTPLKVLSQENMVWAELDIVIDDSVFLRVVDIIEFDENGKIRSIRAFKG
jgi:hypothetical protein